jgi:hypothetical protein
MAVGKSGSGFEFERTHAQQRVGTCTVITGRTNPKLTISKAIGSNPFSEFKGAQYGIGPSSHYEVIPVNGAGGARRVAGDYLYRTQESFNSRAASGHLSVTP